MDINAIAITLVSGFVGVAVLLTIAFSVTLIIKAARGGGPKRTAESDADETRLIQEIHHGLTKMEQRVESLETLLLDEERTKRAKFDRELSEE